MKKSIFLVLLLIGLLFTACGGGSSGGDEERILKEIKLSANKTTIKDDGKEEVTFSITCFDTNNNEYNADVKLYNGDNEVKGNTFSSKETGTFTFIAKSKDLTITSNSISIIVISDVIQNNNSMMKEYVYANWGERPHHYNLYEYNEKGLLIKNKKYWWSTLNSIFYSDDYIEYVYDENDRLIIEYSAYQSMQNIYNIYTYEYNEKGNLIKRINNKKNTDNAETDLSDTYIDAYWVYEYDDNNNLIKEEYFYYLENEWKLLSTVTYEYDNKDKLIKENSVSSTLGSSTSLYEYEDDKLIKIIQVNYGYDLYIYDEQNNLIQILDYEGNQLKTTTTYTYGKYNDFIDDMVEFKQENQNYQGLYRKNYDIPFIENDRISENIIFSNKMRLKK